MPAKGLNLPDGPLDRVIDYLISYYDNDKNQSTAALMKASYVDWQQARHLLTYRATLAKDNHAGWIRCQHFAWEDRKNLLWELVGVGTRRKEEVDKPVLWTANSKLLVLVIQYLVGDGVDYRCFKDVDNLFAAYPKLYEFVVRNYVFVTLKERAETSICNELYKTPIIATSDLFHGFSPTFYRYQPFHLTDPCPIPLYMRHVPDEYDYEHLYSGRMKWRPYPPMGPLLQEATLLHLPTNALNVIIQNLAGIGVNRTAYQGVRNLCLAHPHLYLKRFVHQQLYYDISRRLFATLAFKEDGLDQYRYEVIMERRHKYLLPGMVEMAMLDSEVARMEADTEWFLDAQNYCEELYGNYPESVKEEDTETEDDNHDEHPSEAIRSCIVAGGDSDGSIEEENNEVSVEALEEDDESWNISEMMEEEKYTTDDYYRYLEYLQN